ncbi:MAG: RHS repeat-associated core domain-containing protein, partial [Bacteroidota bacterium]
GRAIEKVYSVYKSDGIPVRRWEIAEGGNSPVRSTLSYATGALDMAVSRDENTNEMRTYTDLRGNVILKRVQVDDDIWADTYYVYDNFGDLRYVLPPELSKEVASVNDYFLEQELLNKWAFQYRYDERRRLVEKKVPGAATEYLVYDRRDRVVMTQNGNLRENEQWLFTKYDFLNRPVMTGMYHAAGTSREALQLEVDDFYPINESAAKYFEVLGGPIHGYTNRSFPRLGNENQCLTVTYYDTYDFPRSEQFPFVPELSVMEVEEKASDLVTGSKVKVLASDTWISSINYYDYKYRLVQAITSNHLGGMDWVTNEYDFAGKVLKNKETHLGKDPYATVREFEYDHQDRLLKTWHQLEVPVVWGNQTGTSSNGSAILKTDGSSGAWDAGASSLNEIPAEEDGALEVKLGDNAAGLFIGLSDEDLNIGYSTIDLAFYLVNDTTLHIREQGTKVKTGIAIQPGDVLMIKRVGEMVSFHKNGTWLYESPKRSLTRLIADVSIRSVGGGIASAKISGKKILLSELHYNELGELIETNLHSEDRGTTFDQSTDYRYNIRGWITSINDAGLETSSLNPDINQPNDLFGMELLYDVRDNRLRNKAQYNGNISAVKWSNQLGVGDVKARAYTYGYDRINRLAKADHHRRGAAWNLSIQEYDVPAISYDLNGNISSLQRRGNLGVMDVLSYRYEGNQLLSVTDQGNKNTGFKDGNTTGDDYAYDASGNLIKDLNKGITEITYNHLNLPEKVQTEGGEFIEYFYDASGMKLQQRINRIRKIEHSSFSANNAGWTLANLKGTVGLDFQGRAGVMKVEAVTKLSNHVVYKSPETIKNKKVRFSAELFIPSSNTNVDGVKLWLGHTVDPTIFNMHDQWFEVTMEAEVKDFGNARIILASGNEILFSGSGDTNDDVVYIQNIRLDEVTLESKKTDYVSDYIYENDTLQFIQHEAGRVVPQTEKVADVTWGFDSDTEGFQKNYQITEMKQVAPGYLELSFSGSDPFVWTPKNLKLDASLYDRVTIKMKNNTSSTKGSLFFNKDTDRAWDYEKYVSFDIEPNSDFVEYTIDLSSLSTWNGMIDQFRLDPTSEGPGSVLLDEMKVIGNGGKEVGYDYQYHLKDHLGNVRLTFSTTPESYTMIEDFEGEQNGFQDVNSHIQTIANTTENGNRVGRLQAGETGAMIFFGVDLGDTIKVEVNANYESAPSGNTFLGTAFQALFDSYNGSIAGGEAGAVIENEFGQALSGAGMAGKPVANNQAPKAYLNYILFDEQMNYVAAGFQQVSTAAQGIGVYETIRLDDVLAKEKGYLLVYLSNENQEAVSVHFDDLTIYQGKTNVVQMDDYYPFGLTFNSYQKSFEKENSFLYNGFELQDELDWNVLDYLARYYDPQIGRFLQVDPAADLMRRHSPYNYAFDNPIRYIDPDGMMPTDVSSSNTGNWTGVRECAPGNCDNQKSAKPVKPGTSTNPDSPSDRASIINAYVSLIERVRNEKLSKNQTRFLQERIGDFLDGKGLTITVERRARVGGNFITDVLPETRGEIIEIQIVLEREIVDGSIKNIKVFPENEFQDWEERSQTITSTLNLGVELPFYGGDFKGGYTGQKQKGSSSGSKVISKRPVYRYDAQSNFSYSIIYNPTASSRMRKSQKQELIDSNANPIGSISVTVESIDDPR